MECQGLQDRPEPLELQGGRGKEGSMDEMELKDVKDQKEKKVNTE